MFLCPSRTDTAANGVLEAQASGLPGIVSDAGGPKENIVNGVTGEVIEGAQAETWVASLVHLLYHEDERVTMSRAARHYALSRSWPSALEPLYRAYRDVATESSASSAVPSLVPRGIQLS
jgi:glycosyltransferase involved in cell wall biosynthesis